MLFNVDGYRLEVNVRPLFVTKNVRIVRSAVSFMKSEKLKKSNSRTEE